MSQLRINDLYNKKNEKNLKRLEIYDSVLVKCHERIKYNSNFEKTYCFYQIPEFIIGVPLYNINEMRKYIINSLKTNGFNILYIDPNWLFISWAHVNNEKSISKKFKEKKKNDKNDKNNNQQFKSIDNYKPDGSLVYDESSILNLSNKLF
jgi:hypothetical protein